jgi:uracil-DNA glycosylase
MTNRRDPLLPRLVLQSLESLAAAGVGQIPKAAGLGESSAPGDAAHGASAASAAPAVPSTPAPHLKKAPKHLFGMDEAPSEDISAAPTLEVLHDEVAQCTLCRELAGTRTQTVLGVGNSEARLCFLGEAPGADEDRLGEPFVGRAGQLLNKILEACGLKREEVYILNVLKCRPPGNRNPLPEESENCRRFLDRQLQLIDPEYICCLGAVAAQNLLSTTSSIGRMRGKIHEYRGIKVVCTYHPAYLLRNPAAKKHTWDDMKLLMREMGTPVE